MRVPKHNIYEYNRENATMMIIVLKNHDPASMASEQFGKNLLVRFLDYYKVM